MNASPPKPSFMRDISSKIISTPSAMQAWNRFSTFSETGPGFHPFGTTSPSKIFSQISFVAPPMHGWKKMTTTHQHPTLNNIPWTVIFPVAVWSIWSARNKFVMESASFDCHIIINKIQSIATDLLYCLPPHLTPSRRSSNLLVGNHCHQTTSN